MLVAYLYLPLPSFTFGKLLVSVTALLLSQLSALFTWLGGAAGSHARFNLLYRWPPCQLLNFTFGMSVGQLARDEAVLAWRGWPWLVDLAAVALCLSLLLAHLYVPILPGCVESGWVHDRGLYTAAERCGLDVFWLSGCNLFFGTMLLGGCASSGARSVVIRLANSSVLSDVGLYTFNIYLVQDMLASEVLKLQAFSAGACSSYLACNALVVDGMYTSSPYGSFDSLWWSIYAATLVGLCKAWYIHVETPWVNRLRGQLAPPQTLLPLTPTRTRAKELV